MTSMLLGRALLVIEASIELSIVAKVTVLLVLALLAVRITRAARASVRHAVLAAALTGIAVLPLVAYMIPPVQVDVPVSVVASPTIAIEKVDSASARRSDVALQAGTHF